MFNWFKRNKPPPTAQDEDIPPQIRKPQHAYRDARMSIPIGEREFYDIIQARKRSSLASSVSNGKWKGKGRLDSGKSFSCFIKTQSLCSMGHGLLCF
jgi:hypothetical protein